MAPRAWAPRPAPRSARSCSTSAAGRRVGPSGRDGDPGPSRDQPRRPARHDRGRRHPRPAAAARPRTPRWWPAAMGKTCVCGAEALDVDARCRPASPSDGCRGREGDAHLDRRHHRHGLPRRGPGPGHHRWSATSRASRASTRTPLVSRRPPVSSAHADEARQLACTGERGYGGRRRPGAAGSAPQGIGLCRTEHMFLGERRAPWSSSSSSPTTDAERTAGARRRCCRCSARTSRRSSPRWTACRSRSRLLDPPAARVPAWRWRNSPSRRGADRGEDRRAGCRKLLARGPAHARTEPDARTAGCAPRASLVPGLYAMQVRAIASSAVALVHGERPHPARRSWCRWSPPSSELDAVRTEIELTLAEVGTPAIPIGTMIEVPRAALTAGRSQPPPNSSPSAPTTSPSSPGGSPVTMSRRRSFSRLPTGWADRRLAVRVDRHRRRGRIDQDRHRPGPVGPTRSSRRRARRTWRRPGVGAFLPRRRPRLPFLLSFRVPVARLEAGRAAISGSTSDTR